MQRSAVPEDMVMLERTLCLLALVFIPSMHVYAQVDKDTNLFELSISELADISISVASKREETIQEAPSIVNVITAEDIRNYGGNNLADLLRRLPSVYDAGGSGTPNTNFNVRGQSSSNLNKHILILLNGRPMHDPILAGWNHTIYQGFPLDAVERIEFIRGPGSVLYGSGAFSAVINIITKKPNGESEASVAITGGTYETKFLELSGGRRKGEFSIFGAAKIGETDLVKGFSDRAGTFSKQPLDQDNFSGFIELQYKGFKLNAFHSKQDGNKPNFPLIFPLIDIEDERTTVDFGYSHNFNSHWQAMANVTFAETQNDSIVNNQKGRAFLFEGNIKGALFNEKLHVLFGITNENLLYESNTSSGKKTERGFYSQIDYKPRDWLKLLGGVQLNDPGSGSFEPSFRVGVIANINKNWGAKLLYSEAFRSPSLGETALTSTAINPPTGLEPEEIATYDAQLFFKNNKIDAALTFFHSKQTKSIRFLRDPNDATSFKFQNFGVTYFDGFELEGKYKANSFWDFEGSVSYQINEQNGVENTQLVPNWQAKLGAIYNNQRGLRLGVFHTYTSDPTSAESIMTTVPVVNPSGDEHHYLSVNMDLTLNQYFDALRSLPTTTFSVYGSDLLESGNFFSPDVNNGVNTIPISPGRSVFATLKVDF
jgi:outer membrane receptor protein involved in Fe transport